MSKEIKDWIASGFPYKNGVELFKVINGNSVLVRLFESGETVFTRAKLKAELLKAVPVPAIKKSPAAVSLLPKYGPEDLPEHLRSEFLRKGELYKIASQLHGDLFHAKSKASRSTLYAQIKDTFDEIDHIWSKCDSYIQNGSEEKPEIPENDRARLIQERNNLRSNLSKARAKKKVEKIVSLELQLAVIEKKLNGKN